jgi:hypothetical protein
MALKVRPQRLKDNVQKMGKGLANFGFHCLDHFGEYYDFSEQAAQKRASITITE